MQFHFAVINSFAVSGVYYPYQGVSLLEVVSPVRAQCLLASNVPYHNGRVSSFQLSSAVTQGELYIYLACSCVLNQPQYDGSDQATNP
jgi:hypothetical protein